MPRVTLKQIADYLSLAPATVSQVLSGRGNTRVADATRKRILDAVDRLGYRPSRLSAALRTKRTHMVGVLVHGVASGETNTYVMAGIEEVLQERGFNFTVVRHMHRLDMETNAVAMLEDHHVDGIVYVPNMSGPSERLVELAKSNFPIVSTGLDEHLPCCQIHVDHVQGGRMVVERLIQTGVRRPAFIQMEGARIPATGSLGQRMRGFRKAYEKDLGPWKQAQIVSSDMRVGNTQFGFEMTQRLLASGSEFDAVVCTNDLIAIGAADALIQAGRTDVALSGYDSLQFIAHLNPRIVTVDHLPAKVGILATQQLVDLINLAHAERAVRHVKIEPILRDYRNIDAV